MLWMDYVQERIDHFNNLTKPINEEKPASFTNRFFRSCLEKDLQNPQKYISDEMTPVTVVYDGETGLASIK